MINRKAKIVCTIGPSSSNENTMKEMIKSGMNVARINMSHGDHKMHSENILKLRKSSKEANKEIAILMDLQGPKIRVEKIKLNNESSFLMLEKDSVWSISSHNSINKMDSADLSTKKYIPTSYKSIFKDVKKGDRVLFNDGLIQAFVLEKTKKGMLELVKIKITVGGKLTSNKGINLPDSQVSAPSLTSKDLKDLLFGIKQDIDFIALSFVRNKRDVLKVKNILKKKGLNIPIISKIEKPEAIDNIEEIVEISDGVMVARGDMGVELGNHLVPKIQKMIISLCNKKGKPVITATQMLESMTENMTPTRAEASDVANAVWDGTDALMLSGETASGIDPVNVIKTMDKIIIEAETLNTYANNTKNKNLPESSESFNLNIQNSAKKIADCLSATFIVVSTINGVSVQMLSSLRPKTKIVAYTNKKETLRKCCLMWGVDCRFSKKITESNNIHNIYNQLKNLLLLKNEDIIVFSKSSGKFSKTPGSNKIEVLKY